ncbi:hypothetical protein M758_2G047800 [Ceratodon purpureus]|nr:hypothetical protein M758_2G047800 [Ceratodon purpureus]
MAPTVYYADPDGRGAAEGDNEPEGFVSNAVETGAVQQGELKLSTEIPEQGTVSESVALKDGRRRSSRLKGKVSPKDTGTGDESPSVVKEASGSWKKGRRKKAVGLESAQSIGDSVEEVLNDVNLEASPQELTKKSEDSGASPAGDVSLVRCASISREPVLQHANGEEKTAKVNRLHDLPLSEDSLSGDGEVTAIAKPLVDTKGDFCDSNIFGDLQSIVNLHPDENGILSEVPSSSKGKNEEKVERQVGDLSEAISKKEGSAKENTGPINYAPRDVGPEETAVDEVTTLITVQASCETTRIFSKDMTGSETEPVVSDPQEEGASRGSTSKVGDFDSQVLANGNNGKQKEYSSVSEGRATLKMTSETSCLRSDGEGIVQLEKKSDSLKSVNQEIGVSDGDVAGTMKVESSVELTRSHSVHTENTAGGEDDSSGVTEGDDNTSGEKVDESVSINSKAGWVKCDDCNKWRSIPVELAEKIGDTNAYWSCKENPNKSFADCSIPQVKSNEEINKDLGISESSSCDEEDDAEATCDSKPTYSGRPTVTVNGQAIWKEIKRNIFKHRKQKHQDADEAMVCQCATPKPGEVGCGEDCLNRMLNVECLPQMCPCGSLCTNQQFQKRDYAKVELFRCGKKGHGLQAKQRIPRGSFVIEYVGEVLDMPSFEARQKEYSMNSQKHFYFMTLSANEVIDACSKGNYGRFINHSCDPNCQTEKWMVDGEVCIGLFAIRDVEKGEEITFDYNFVRVGGADAKKCECGANKCRGFIGVDPDTPQNVLEIDSDDGEDPEPIMIQADSDDEPGDYLDKAKTVAKKARIMSSSEGIYENNSKYGGVKRKFYSGAAKDVKLTKKSRRVKTAATSKISSHKPVPPRLFAGSRFGVRNTYYSDAESKLGELTNETGGLRKRGDTAKQYLKLLVLTSASGGNGNGAAACSARDLSMLLEALLRTQKSSLLQDIMNKNGLQMLHNLIKTFRKSFEKRPILRKLLKVLDHLAKKRVLTVELIYSPPRSGTECFTDTLFDLSRHDDTEVQNMARNFRKLHVPPRPPKPIMNTERPLVKSPSQQSSVALPPPPVAASQVGLSANNKSEQDPAVQEGLVEGNSANPPTTTKRRRPSRWDTVTETGTAIVPSASSGMPISAAASPHGGSSEQASSSITSKSPFPTASGSLQGSVPARSDALSRHSIPPSPTGMPGRPSGITPVRPHQVYSSGLQHQLYPPGLQPQVYPPGVQPQVYPPGHIPVGMPGQRPGVSLGPMHYSMQGASSQIPTVGGHPFAMSRGHTNQVAPSMHGVPYLMHGVPRGAPVYAGPPFPPPPPPLPPSGRPAWGHSGQRQLDGFSGRAPEVPSEAADASKGQLKRGHSASQSSSMKTASNEPGESEEAREPSVPGMSPARPQKERTTSGVSASTQGPARPPNEVGSTRSEASPHAYRGEHGTRTYGHDANVVNRSRNITESRVPIQQGYSRPDNREATHGRGEREMSWDTPECSSFHHHVSGMIRARVEKKRMVHYKDLEKFCSKLTEVVTRKEIKKYRENKTQGMQKVILRSKLLEKVDAYVDLQIEVYRKLKSGEGQS